MKANLFTSVLLLAASLVASAQSVEILFTTDVHGSVFPYNFVESRQTNQGLAHAYSYIESVRDTAAHTLLIDGGDFLQGTPVTYYYNHIDTAGTNIMARIFNFMKYDAVVVGNHDIEVGHGIYDKVRSQMQMPLLAANAVDTKTGEPYFQPYKVVDIEGKKLVLLGMITPTIPYWLPEYLWHGMEFEDIVESSRKWVGIIREREKPDAIIGIFHSGFDYNYGGQNANSYKNENAAQLVAMRVSGFDAILCGHDHKFYDRKIKNPEGREIPFLDAGSRALRIGHMSLRFNADGSLEVVDTKLVQLSDVEPSQVFLDEFQASRRAVLDFSKQKVCTATDDIYAYEALFGSSTFVEMLHRAMLSHTGADVSLTAPLLLGTKVKKGVVTVGKMFGIYRYENMVSVIRLTGKEIKDYLEYSYSLWVSNPDETGHILRLNKKNRLIGKSYHFDSAMGIDYTVDPYKPKGQRVNILGMSNGDKFSEDKEYNVVLNSFRCNGGGGHLTRGLGLTYDEIQSRIVCTVNHDLRSLLMTDLKDQKTIGNQKANNWRFVPEDKVQQYISIDMEIFK